MRLRSLLHCLKFFKIVCSERFALSSILNIERLACAYVESDTDDTFPKI
mgnify:CR=1 FL=1